MSAWGVSWETAGIVLVATAGVYALVIALTRLSGVRSLAKMSSFDFAATVAIGSTVSSTALSAVPFGTGAVAVTALFLLQFVVAVVRRAGLARGVFDNQPVLLMADGEVLDDGLARTRVSRDELMGQLRLAGIQRLDQVGAVVMETTGEVSVLRAGDLSPELLAGVRGAEQAPLG